MLGASVDKNNNTNNAAKTSVDDYSFSRSTQAVSIVNNNNKNTASHTAGKLSSSISGAVDGVVDAKVSGSKGGFGSGSHVSRNDGKDMVRLLLVTCLPIIIRDFLNPIHPRIPVI